MWCGTNTLSTKKASKRAKPLSSVAIYPGTGLVLVRQRL
jgi:hypothetical protein